MTTGSQPADRTTMLQSRVDRYVAFDRANRPYLEWQIRRFLPFLGPRVLEIGCGVGSIIELLGRRELIAGVDIEQEVIAYTAARFPDRSLYHFRQLDFGALSEADLAWLRDVRCDTVICLNVLEHIEDDVEALRTMRELLPAGGRLALLVPAHPSLYGDYDRLDGHFRRYTKAMLEEAFRKAGFTRWTIRHFNAVGAFGWWVSYKLLSRKIHGEGDFRLMNALVPLVSRIESVIPPPVGLSLMAVVDR